MDVAHFSFWADSKRPISSYRAHEPACQASAIAQPFVDRECSPSVQQSLFVVDGVVASRRSIQSERRQRKGMRRP
uniref:Uncharacterized protein n=1 Tax=Steinernema glaseri TaxID=37863 RepID=A0A1I8ADI1_9BILA